MRLFTRTSNLAAALGAATLILGAPALASADAFALADGGINQLRFESEAPVETVTGVTTKVTGALDIDLKDPNKSTGSLTFPVTSLLTGNTTRDGHLASEGWLDAAKHPDIAFKVTKVALKSPKPLTDGTKLEGDVTGDLTIRGVTKSVTAPISLVYKAKSPELEKVWIGNDAVRVKASFGIKLSDFGVKIPDNLAGVKVSDEVTITARLTAVKQ